MFPVENLKLFKSFYHHYHEHDPNYQLNFLPAGVLSSLPYQSTIRRVRTLDLQTQPRLWHHDLSTFLFHPPAFLISTWLVLPAAVSCNQESRIIRWQGSWSDKDDSGTCYMCHFVRPGADSRETWDVLCVIFDTAGVTFCVVWPPGDNYFGRHDLTLFCV